MRFLLALTVILVLILAGCVTQPQQNTPAVYACSDGRQVKNASLCSNQAASNSTNQNQQANRTNEPTPSQSTTCPENLSGILTVPLMDIDQIAAIEPLGAINGGDHLLPVDHVYFNTNIKAAPMSPKLPVYAPADVIITRIDIHQNIFANGTPEDEPEFFIDFVVCNGVTIWMEGIHELSPPLESIFNKSNKTYDEGLLNQGERSTNYMVDLSYAAKAGEIIAWTGGKNPYDSIAVSAFNDNIKLRDDVNYSYYPERRKTAFCFIDLYNGDLKKSIENKLGFYDMKLRNDETASETNTTPTFIPRTQEPRCGELVQNIPGTIQGDWFYGTPPENNEPGLEAQGKTLSFIHKNIDPSKAIISIGGNFMRTGGTEFIPNHSGFINREPSEVRAYGNVYCYNRQEGLWTLMDGKILVQLIDNNHLKVEHQEGDCTGAENFVNPFIYQR